MTDQQEEAKSMQNTQNATYLSADQLEERAAARIMAAEQLPPGETRQHALRNAAQLRSFAAMKRLLAPDRSGAGSKAEA